MQPHHRRIGIIVFAVILIAGITFFAVRTGREEAPKFDTKTETPTPVVTLKDSYKKGVHTYTGTYTVATPCHTISATATVAVGTPDVVTIAITAPADEGMCVQVIATKTFTVTATAGKDAKVEVQVNGVPATIQ